MTDREFALQQQTARRNITKTFLRGLKRICTDIKFTAIFLLAAALIGSIVADQCLNYQSTLIDLSAIIIPGYCALGFGALLCTIYALGIIPKAREMHNNLERIGFTNSAHEAPTVEQIEKLDKRHYRITFESKGLRAEEWTTRQSEVESALNLILLRITDGEDMRKVVVVGVRPTGALPEKILWHPSFASEDKYTLVVGESQAGIVTANLLRTPHWLIGSTTGMGKTQTLTLIIEQCLNKGMHVVIADWKQGIDFCPRIQNQCDFVSNYEDFKRALGEMEELIEHRAYLYNKAKSMDENTACNNTSVYQSLTGEELQHYVFIVDEASMVFDSTGRSKEIKTTIAEVIEKINAIGRIGRAYGLHLIICTQRPEVSSVPGSLKGNLDGRLAGHMTDNASSIVILDNGNAAKLPAIPGRFIIQNGMGTEQTFQAYLMPPKDKEEQADG